MESTDITVIRDLLAWRRAGEDSILVTVVNTASASSRPVGSIMALRNDGRTSGLVSGGGIEDDLIMRFHGAMLFSEGQPPQLLTYGATPEEARRYGLADDGPVELLLEFNPDTEALARCTADLKNRQLVRRSVALDDGRVTLTQGTPSDECIFDGRQLAYTLSPGCRMLLIGAGALAECIASIAMLNGFCVTVCDPRAEYVNSWSLQGVRILMDMPDDAVADFLPDSHTCIVALTRDSALDDAALLEALDSDAFYIGAFGSHKNNHDRCTRFNEQCGVTPASLARLHDPAGLAIGSRTPAEIAVSIMADILAVKNSLVSR